MPLLEELQTLYAGRGVNLVRVAGKWAFRTAEDLSFLLEHYSVEQRKLSRAALETLAIIAYHQPVTRAEIEEIRGVSTSKGSLDVLLEIGWLRLRGAGARRAARHLRNDRSLPRPFRLQFHSRPAWARRKGAGLLDSNLPPGFAVPEPDDSATLREDEEPLEDEPAGEHSEEEEDETGSDSAADEAESEAPEETHEQSALARAVS